MKKIRKLFNDLISLLKVFFDKVDVREEERSGRVREWNEVRGDLTYRLNYKLDSKSIVFDVGGYLGQWTSDIYSKYQCSIFIFEPVKEYYKFICKRFSKNRKITCIHAGLGSLDRYEKISVYNENSSTLNEALSGSLREENIRITDISKFIHNTQISKIDLIKINIEGGEYELLEHMIQTNIIKIIDNVQIQFHSFVSDANNRRDIISRKLSKTHKLTYNFPYIWENWERKSRNIK